MGEVWRGRHRDQDVAVAVKIVTAQHARAAEFRAVFRNEVRAVAAMQHPKVVMVFDYGEIPPEVAEVSDGALVAGCPYLVMEWASSGNLRKHRIDSWFTLRSILIDLLDALAHAHARGVIHRDMKLGNVLLCSAEDPRPGLKLADFGLARPRHGRGRQHRRVGRVRNALLHGPGTGDRRLA